MSCTELQRGSLSVPQYLSCSDLATLIGDISKNLKVKIGRAQEPHCLHSHNSHAYAFNKRMGQVIIMICKHHIKMAAV